MEQSTSRYAPIALFVYKRPEQVQHVLAALQQNPAFAASPLHIFCDGPKGPADAAAVAAARAVVRALDHPQLTIQEHAANRGLAQSIVAGVTELCARYGRAIVIEDDVVVASGFLDYHNRALDQYAAAPQVLQISGHVFPFPNPTVTAPFFLPLATSQGWSTWQRAWQLFDPDSRGVAALRTDRALRRRFDLNGAYPYTKNLLAQVAGRGNSWAIRWWWSFFQHDGLCLYPHVSLLHNIGFGIGAANTKGADTYYNDPFWSPTRHIERLPTEIVADQASYRRLQQFIGVAYGSLAARLKRRLRRGLNALQERFGS